MLVVRETDVDTDWAIVLSVRDPKAILGALRLLRLVESDTEDVVIDCMNILLAWDVKEPKEMFGLLVVVNTKRGDVDRDTVDASPVWEAEEMIETLRLLTLVENVIVGFIEVSVGITDWEDSSDEVNAIDVGVMPVFGEEAQPSPSPRHEDVVRSRLMQEEAEHVVLRKAEWVRLVGDVIGDEDDVGVRGGICGDRNA